MAAENSIAPGSNGERRCLFDLSRKGDSTKLKSPTRRVSSAGSRLRSEGASVSERKDFLSCAFAGA